MAFVCVLTYKYFKVNLSYEKRTTRGENGMFKKDNLHEPTFYIKFLFIYVLFEPQLEAQ